jgi:hypothetical protein
MSETMEPRVFSTARKDHDAKHGGPASALSTAVGGGFGGAAFSYVAVGATFAPLLAGAIAGAVVSGLIAAAIGAVHRARGD